METNGYNRNKLRYGQLRYGMFICWCLDCDEAVLVEDDEQGGAVLVCQSCCRSISVDWDIGIDKAIELWEEAMQIELE